MEWGPFREKFHQYILSNLSNIVTTTVQSNLNTSFTADLAVSVAEQDRLAATNGSSNSDTPFQTYLTDTTVFTAEVWLYCGILIAVIAVLIVSGVCHTIHLVINQSNTPNHPTQERRPISPPAPPLLPLLSIRDQTAWAAPFNDLPQFHFAPQSTRFPNYDYPPFPPKPVYHIVDFLPLPEAPNSVCLEDTIFSSDTEFPPPPSPLQLDECTVGDEYWEMN